MSFCSIKSCKSTSRNCKGTDVYFHQLQSSSELRKLLKSNVKGKTKSVCVCSKHFLESDYVRDLKSELLGTDKRKILVSGAFPSVNLGDKNNETNESDSIDVSQNVSSAVASNTGISTLDSSEASWRTKVGILCRLCAKSDYGCVPIFKGKSVDDEVKMKIEKYLYIQLNEEDGLPDQVCPGCLTAVSAWHIFAEECLKVNVKLQELLSNEESQELSTLRKKGQKNGKSSEAFMPDQRCAEEGNGDTDIKTEIIKEEIDIEENSLRTAGNTQFENVSLVVVPENLWNSARKSVDPLHTTGTTELMCPSKTTVASNRETCGNTSVRKKINEEIGIKTKDNEIENIRNSDCSDIDVDLQTAGGDIDNETNAADTDSEASCNNGMKDNVQSNSKQINKISRHPSKDPVNKHIKNSTDHAAETSCSSSDKRKSVFSEDESVKCHVCNKFCKPGLYRKHMRSHWYCCYTCYKIYQSEEELLRHKKEHKSGSMCEICGKILISDNTLRKHMKTHLPVEQREKFECEVCGAIYSNLSHLKIHLQSKHYNQKVFACDTCGKTFSTLRLIRVHVMVHSEISPHKCFQCHKSFKWSKNLGRHMVNVHEGIESYAKRQINMYKLYKGI